MAKDNNIDKKQLNFLQKLFKIGIKPSAETPSEQMFPIETEIKRDKKGKEQSIEKIGKEKFPPIVQKYYDYFMSTHDNNESWKNRQDLWKDMELLYYNCAYISRAIELITDEVVQADINMQPIFVEASKKQRDFILQFYENIGLYNLIKPAARDIVWFGNHGWLLSLTRNGVEEVIPVEPQEIDERMEFTPYEVEDKMKKDGRFKDYSRMERVKQMIDSILNKENIASFFKTYLLGFVVGGYAIPPWRFLHFRNYTTKSPFKPFGVPMFVHSIAPYRMWDAAMTFQGMARASNFPIDKYTIKLPNIVDPAEKLSKVNSFVEKIDNLGAGVVRKDNDSFGSRIFTIEDLFDFEQISRNIDLGKIDDIEMLQDLLIVSTRLPRNVIDPNDSGFGDSGVSLVQKYKELSRLVFTIQSAILENVTQLTKIHMLLSGKFELKDIDFVLSMPYPEQQTNSELVNNQQDLITLTNDIIDALSDRLLNGGDVPDEVVVDVYNKILPYDQKTIDNWTGKILKAKKKGEIDMDNPDGTDDPEDKDNKKDNEPKDDEPEDQEESNRLQEWRKVEKSFGKRKIQEIINDIIYEERQKGIKEGLIRNKHFYSSNKKYMDFDLKELSKFDKNRIKALKENKGDEKDKFDYREEVKYIFDEKKNKKKKEK